MWNTSYSACAARWPLGRSESSFMCLSFFQVLGWKELLNMAMMTSICIEMDVNRCKSYRNV